MSESHSRCDHDLYKTLPPHDYLLTQGPSINGQSSLFFFAKTPHVSDCSCNFKWRKELIASYTKTHLPRTAEQPPALRETPLQPSEFSSMPDHRGSAQYLQQVSKEHYPEKIREVAGKNLCGQPGLLLWLSHEQAQGRGSLLQVQPGTRLCHLISCSAWWEGYPSQGVFVMTETLRTCSVPGESPAGPTGSLAQVSFPWWCFLICLP